MSLRRLRPHLLLLAVLLGQWLGFAHASQHEVLEPGDAVCAYCVSGIGSAPPPAQSLAFVLADVRAEAPCAPVASRADSTRFSLHRNRGPPSPLV